MKYLIFLYIFFYLLKFNILTSLLGCYFISLLDGSGKKIKYGSRSWEKFQKLSIWSWIIKVLVGKTSIVCTNKDKISKIPQAIIALHPHGVLSLSHLLICTNCAGYMDLFPYLSGDNRRNLVASIVMYIPFLRDFLLWLGMVDASMPVAKNILKNNKSLVVIPGGEKEQLLTKFDKHILWIKERKGFCKLAVEFGLPIIPHYTFGETSMYTTSCFLHNIRWWICDKFHIALPLASGRWNISFPFCLPLKPTNGINLCIGDPIYSSLGNHKLNPIFEKDKFNEEVDKLHNKYLESLKKLFDENKYKFGFAEAELIILPE